MGFDQLGLPPGELRILHGRGVSRPAASESSARSFPQVIFPPLTVFYPDKFRFSAIATGAINGSCHDSIREIELLRIRLSVFWALTFFGYRF